jgi:hypothetical protein
MSDLNYMVYGENALRVFDSVGDNLSFWDNNSYVLGIIIAVLLVLAIIVFILMLMVRFGKRLLP